MQHNRHGVLSDRVFTVLAGALAVLALGAATIQLRTDGFTTTAYALLLVALPGVFGVRTLYRAAQSGWESRGSAWLERGLIAGGFAATLWLLA